MDTFSLNDFFPGFWLIPFLIYSYFSHEIAEWSYARTKGAMGSSAVFGLFVDVTAIIGQFALYIFIVAYAYDEGWKKAIGLFVLILLLGFLEQFLAVVIKRSLGKLYFLFQIICLGAFYGILSYISYKLTWFGFFH